MSENKQYENEYKVQAVKLAKKIGAVNAANELQIPINTLYGWIRKARLPILAFQIQPYSVLTGICSSSASAFADPRFLANLTACSLYSSSYSLFFDIFVSSVFPFFYFIPLWLMCQVLLYRIRQCSHSLFLIKKSTKLVRFSFSQTSFVFLLPEIFFEFYFSIFFW